MSEVLFREENEKAHSLSLLCYPLYLHALLQHSYLQQAVCTAQTLANLETLLLLPSLLFMTER